MPTFPVAGIVNTEIFSGEMNSVRFIPNAYHGFLNAKEKPRPEQSERGEGQGRTTRPQDPLATGFRFLLPVGRDIAIAPLPNRGPPDFDTIIISS